MKLAGGVLISINEMIETQDNVSQVERKSGTFTRYGPVSSEFAAMLSALRGYVTTRNRIYRGEFKVNLTDNHNVWNRLKAKAKQLEPNSARAP